MIFSLLRNRKVILAFFFLACMGAALLLGFWYINGPSLGPKSFARDFLFYLKNIPKLMAHQDEIVQSVERENDILFLHHSVGVGFIRDGRLRELLEEEGYHLWDQGYRGEELSGPDGVRLGFSYNVPADNTDPDGFYALFSQKEFDLPINGISQVLQHDIIVLKSCYPVSYIYDDAKLQEYKGYYLQIRNVMDQHPEKLFIILTQPPLNPAATDAEIAGRARALANWLKSDEFVNGHQNLAVFDLFDVLAEPDPTKPDVNMLREEYRSWDDSHPNVEGNSTAAQLIADYISEKAMAFDRE